MKIGIDSYCYHRYFGEWYRGLQSDPAERRTVWDFLARAQALGVHGVSLESCFLPWDDAGFLSRLRAALDAAGLERVWAWGHPNGLHSGARPEEAESLRRHLGVARALGARVMRICGGSRHTRPADWAAHRDGLLALLRPLCDDAARHGVVMAMENHIDVSADELAELVERVDSPWFGVCLDTANNLRLLEDPVRVARVLAPYTRATHVKDVLSHRGDPRSFGFWPSVPLGQGAVDLPQVLRLLADAGYDGLLAIEIDYLHPDHGDEDGALARSVDFLQRELRVLSAATPSAAPVPGAADAR